MNVLITGGAGFFGSIMKQYLSEKGIDSVIYDLAKDVDNVPRTIAVEADIRNPDQLDACMKKYGPFDVVFHLAAQLAHNVSDKNLLWTSNVDGTRRVVEAAVKNKIPHLVFTSSNCLWGNPFHRKVMETDIPHPIEIYGVSKWEGEKILLEYKDTINITIIRCPTIMDAGRLGLLSILYEFIEENKKVYVVGGGDNIYQFIYARDLAEACFRSFEKTAKSDIFNIGSDNVKSFKNVYQYVIDNVGSTSRVVPLPKAPTLMAMKICYKLGLSPLGPYQYKMIAEDFVFETEKIKQTLEWRPTLTNEEMLLRAFNFYKEHKNELAAGGDVPAHRQKAKMGIIRVLKYFS